MEELVHLAHLANIIPDDEVQQAGKQMSHRWAGIEVHCQDGILGFLTGISEMAN